MNSVRKNAAMFVYNDWHSVNSLHDLNNYMQSFLFYLLKSTIIAFSNINTFMS